MTLMKGREIGKDFFYGYIIVTVSFIIMFIFWAAFYAFGVFFKPVLKEFNWTRAMTAGAFSLCSIVQGLLSIAMGELTDRFGPRLVMTICGLFLGLGYILMSQVSAIWHLYLFYGVIVGVGMGGSFVPLSSTIARWFVERRSMMTGIVLSGTGIGALIGPPVVSRLILGYGWRLSYILMGSTIVLLSTLCAQLLKPETYKMEKNDEYDKKGKDGQKMYIKGLSLREAAYTMDFWILLSMILSLGFCVFAIMVHIVPHAMEIGISTISAANILAVIGGASVFGKVLLGRMADRIGSKQTFIIGFTLMTGALLGFLSVKLESILYFFAALFGFAFGGCVSVESPIVAELFGLISHGLILGVIAFSFLLGGALGPFILGYIFDLTGSYKWGFLFCVVISFLGLILTSTLKRKATPFHPVN